MPAKMTKRYCASPAILNTLKRDGIGWGHDLSCGSFEAQRLVGPSFIQRLKRNKS